jgi:hypothetical protein
VSATLPRQRSAWVRQYEIPQRRSCPPRPRHLQLPRPFVLYQPDPGALSIIHEERCGWLLLLAGFDSILLVYSSGLATGDLATLYTHVCLASRLTTSL